MKKEEVYKLIEYDGIYDDKVKRNLKRLIKKYHPDKNKKDKKTIEIIYEVKKELENNKVSYKPQKINIEKKESFISEDECLKNIVRLEKMELGNNKELNKLYDNLSITFKEYSNLYRKFCLTKNRFCILEDELKEIKKISFVQKIIFLILIIFSIINIVVFNKMNLIIIVGLIIILVIYSYFCNKKNKVVIDNMKSISNKINKNTKEIVLIQEKIRKLSDEIHSLERKNNNVKNDIRFYKNMKEK